MGRYVSRGVFHALLQSFSQGKLVEFNESNNRVYFGNISALNYQVLRHRHNVCLSGMVEHEQYPHFLGTAFLFGARPTMTFLY